MLARGRSPESMPRRILTGRRGMPRLGLLTIAIVVALGLASAAGYAASVVPTVLPGAANTDKTCALNYPGTTELKRDAVDSKAGTYVVNGTVNGQSVSVTFVVPSAFRPASDTSTNNLDFSAAPGTTVYGVIVKDGIDGANSYAYPDGTTSDTYLTTPVVGGSTKNISHVSFCVKPAVPQYQPLGATKTAAASYERKVTWALTKTVAPDSHSGQAGETAGSSTWTVTAGKTTVDSDFTVTGEITVTNPNPIPVDFQVTDRLDDDTVAAVDCRPLLIGDQPTGTVAANGSAKCTYLAKPAGRAATENAAYVVATTANVPTDPNPATAPISWTEILTGSGTATLADARFGYSESISDGEEVTFPETFTCPADPSLYENGKQTFTERNTATLVAGAQSLSADAEVAITCSAKPTSAIEVVKSPKAQTVYADGTASYTYKVTNTGTSDLSNVTVGDDRCSPLTRTDAGNNDAEDLLEQGETWTYTCSVSAAALFGSSSAPVTNTVTASGVDRAEQTVTDTDTAVTNLLVPGIAIDKTGPATAVAGALLTYDMAVTNTGNTSFPAAEVKLTDTVVTPAGLTCAGELATPKDKKGDQTPTELNPGETWVYQCQVQTALGQTLVDNRADVTGTDAGGKTVSASDSAQTTLTQPEAVIQPEAFISSRARMSGSVGCVTARYARATVSGSPISRVTFYVNGKLAKRLTKPNSGRNYLLRYRTKSLDYGTYKVRAVVRFQNRARPQSRTMKLQFSRCRPRVVRPTFTG